ncbi:alkylated DNA repair protein alkB like 6 [Capronia epimyces CBS 606.96]|uniref:Alkylated DNA repair protein alkB like 6 n=1 Tax=Capronia epimyces CBS 606.96 TaxID=1182542 RepID=W9YH99_9EURO|nr:alkylated DNA repair protein alkB like 6 [Capronia epimyces CBS 606.96]EXJ89035.1 alkylated DNA repair protein alkB like 6 [Capronia epimyces CBS 606.96]
MTVAPIEGLPPSCYYFHSFISPAEEEQIIKDIRRLPESRWTALAHRRLLSLPSNLTGSSHDILVDAPLPTYLDPIVARLKDQKFFEESPHRAPNHVLINEYRPGEGIMPHEDGPAYSPITATVSLGSHTVLEIYQKTEQGEREAKPTWRILQEPRSLLVTTGDMYVHTLHGISEIETDENLNRHNIVNWDLLGDGDLYESGRIRRQTRISLTLRDVVKVAKLGGAMKFITRGRS